MFEPDPLLLPQEIRCSFELYNVISVSRRLQRSLPLKHRIKKKESVVQILSGQNKAVGKGW